MHKVPQNDEKERSLDLKCGMYGGKGEISPVKISGGIII